MRIIISPHAEKELKKVTKINQIAIARKIRSLTDINIFGVEKLSGFKNIFRVRVGYYRIVYRRTSQQVYIILISHRKDIYRLVNQLLK